MLGQFNLWEMLAGLGIFLFGIFLMEESIKNLSGRAFKTFIRKYTSTPLKGILSGTITTAILQSSSVVSLMLLAFVGAGIMSMQNAIGVILGSNLGTTLTSWIVATVGFKVDIESLALPFVGLGGLGLIFFGKSTRATNISKLTVGFGFLFMGLNYMKSSIDAYAQSIDLASLPDYGIFIYLFAGFVITAIIQSSSASMAIILSAIYSGILGFIPAAAMVIGTNLGTTVTVLLGSLDGETSKKRVAISHVIFNLITGVAALFLLYPMTYLIQEIMGLKDDPIIALALFHTLFNLMGIILFFPFIKLFAKMVSKVIPEKKRVSSASYIHSNTTDVPEAAIESFFKEALLLFKTVMLHNLKILYIDQKLVISDPDEKLSEIKVNAFNPQKIYAHIKEVQAELFAFASIVQQKELSDEEARKLNKYLHAIRYAVSSAKTLKDIRHNLEEMDNSDDKFILKQYNDFRKKIMELYISLDQIISNPSEDEKLATIVKLMQKVYDEDSHFIRSLTSSIDKNNLMENEISLLLTVNRNFLLSARQILLGIKDLLLDEKEEDIYEAFDVEGAESRKIKEQD